MSNMVNVHAEYWKTINDLSRDKKELLHRIKRLEELGHELRECASRIGTVASGEGSAIRRTEEAIQAWDKEANQ